MQPADLPALDRVPAQASPAPSAADAALALAVGRYPSRDRRKYQRVAVIVRGMIADGTLQPGQPAPSSAALSRATGFAKLTCRRAVNLLLADGTLLPGHSAYARPRVASRGLAAAGSADAETAARDLSRGLANRRRAARLTQPQLADLVQMSVTTVGHAETGRLWQGRDFWERADTVLKANGALLSLHDAYCRADSASPVPQSPSHHDQDGAAGPDGDTTGPAVAVALTLSWSNGLATKFSLEETGAAPCPDPPEPGLRPGDFHFGLLTACSALLSAARTRASAPAPAPRGGTRGTAAGADPKPRSNDQPEDLMPPRLAAAEAITTVSGPSRTPRA